MTFDEMVGRSRTKNVALARQIAMYLAREMTSMSLVDIGEVLVEEIIPLLCMLIPELVAKCRKSKKFITMLWN